MLYVAIVCTSTPSQTDRHFVPLPVALPQLQVDHSLAIEEKYSKVVVMYGALLKYTERSQSLSFPNKPSKIVEALCLSVTLIASTFLAFKNKYASL